MTLKPIPLHILLVLADGDSHGYRIMQTIRARTSGSITVQTASFYRHLGNLIDEGLVAEVSAKREGDDPRRGTNYRLTPRGRQMLSDEKRRLTELVAQMKKIPLGARKAPL